MFVFGNLACFVSLQHLSSDSPFCLITDDFKDFVLADVLSLTTLLETNAYSRHNFELFQIFLQNHRLVREEKGEESKGKPISNFYWYYPSRSPFLILEMRLSLISKTEIGQFSKEICESYAK